MKLASVKTRIIAASSASALETQVNTFLADGGEWVLVDIKYQQPTSGEYSALILYTT